MLRFIQILGEADSIGLVIIELMLKIFGIGMVIFLFIIVLLPIIISVYLICKLVIHLKRIECKNYKKRIPKLSTYCSYCGTKND